MTTIVSHKDPERLTLTLIAEFAATAERLWQVWADPRQMERWWGPPEWPATFDQHDFTVGGRAGYVMTGPEGEKSYGWLRFTALESPRRIEFDDGFADENGEPVGSVPLTHAVVTFEPIEGGTRMTTVSRFADVDALEQALAMGADEGWEAAVGQIPAVLAAEGEH